MSDDVKARARQVLRPVSAGGTVLRGLHGEGVESLVADLLAALERAEAYAVERSKLASDTRHAAMQFRDERDDAHAVIRNLLGMCVMADVIDEGYAAEVRTMVGEV